MVNGYLLTLAIIIIWAGLLAYLYKIEWLKKHNMTFWIPPIVMWRTGKGRSVIDRMASRSRFWTAYANVSIWICLILMVASLILVAYDATLLPLVKQAPSPRLLLALPGINPVIPVGYGILALAVTLVVHEFAHGILTRVGKMKVLSIGLLLFVVPIGAFVEPDEEDMKRSTPIRRMRVYSAGPGTNVIVAVLLFAILAGLMIPSLKPAHDGALSVGVVDGSPAMRAGIRASCVIVSVDGNSVANSTDIENRIAPQPGSSIDISYYLRGRLFTAHNVTDGLVVSFVADGFAASKAGLAVGDVLVSLNKMPIGNLHALYDLMSHARAGQDVNVSVMRYDASAGAFENTTITTIEFSDKYEYYQKYDSAANSPSYRGVGFIGAGFLDLGLDLRNVTYYARLISQPFAGDRTPNDVGKSVLFELALPFFYPISSSQITDLYHPSGTLGWMPDAAFWLIAGSLYWIFWLNFAVGLFNVLPVSVFDGGGIFKDTVRYLLDARGNKYTEVRKEAIVKAASTGASIITGVLVILLVIGPYLSVALQG